MVSQFRKQKYYFAFVMYLDHDHNGKVDIKDIEVLVERMMVQRRYNKKDLCERWMKILNGMLEFIGVNRTGAIYFDDWVAAWMKYADNPSFEPTWFRSYWEIAFEYFGDTKGHVYTLDSYVGGFIPFGGDREEITLAYKKMSPSNPVLDKNEVFKLWKEYFVSDDPNAPGTYLCGKVNF